MRNDWQAGAGNFRATNLNIVNEYFGRYGFYAIYGHLDMYSYNQIMVENIFICNGNRIIARGVLFT